jgi:hypothetical protein
MNFKTFLKQEYEVDLDDSEIKKVSPQIRSALKVLKAFDGDIFHNDVSKCLMSIGFKKDGSSGVAFIGKTQVLKYSSFSCDTIRPEDRIPTLCLEGDNDWQLVIQPKIKPVAFPLEPGIAKQINRLQKRNPKAFDIEYYNVGYYKDKLVAFDW